MAPIRRINGVKAYVSRGKTYAYHRRTGKRLKSPYGSAEFFVELAALEKLHTQQAITLPGTWGALVRLYRTSAKWGGLALRTRQDYERVFGYLGDLDRMPLPQWTRGFVNQLRDKALQQRKRRFANYVISVVQAVFTWAVDNEHVDENSHPARRIKKVKRPKGLERANRPWSRDEFKKILTAPAHIKAPLLLAGVLGWRAGEIVSRPRSDYDQKANTIKRIASKSGKLVKTPVPNIVAEALDALYPHDAVTLVVTSRKRPWTTGGFTTSMLKWMHENIAPDVTVHGLRHTCGTSLRELGYDLQTIADMLGQENVEVADWYSRDADLSKKLAGVVERLDKELG